MGRLFPKIKYSVVSMLCTLLMSNICFAQYSTDELFEISLEELLKVEVEISSISRRSQSLTESAAAAYVLDENDIRQSSAINLPDLLRTVPGIEVAQLDSNKWAISARGFNSRLASKLRLIIDGRAIYSSDFGVVYWETEDLPLELIKRIEVIRGPGATIWGANAVNGVINITTKSSEQHQGTKLSLTSGSLNSVIANIIHGGEINSTSTYSIYGSFKDSDSYDGLFLESAEDEWETSRAGLRIDLNPSSRDIVSVQVNIFDQTINHFSLNIVNPALSPDLTPLSFKEDSKYNGLNFITNWQHQFNQESSFTTQFIYDRRETKSRALIETVETVNVNFYYNGIFNKHYYSIGGATKLVFDDKTPTPFVSFSPNHEVLETYNFSFYDDIHFSKNTIVGLGLTLEKNIYTDFEYQSNLRFNHALNDNQNVWAAISRAVRTPARAERSSNIILLHIPRFSSPEAVLDTFIVSTPIDSFNSEILRSIEAGWRYKITDNLNLDIAAFANHYSDLRNAETTIPYCSPDPICSFTSEYLIQPVDMVNQDEADAYGIEALFQWKYSEQLNFELSYSYFEIDYTNGGGELNGDSSLTANLDNPLEKLTLQSHWKIDQRSNLNLVYRYMSKPGISNISSYNVFDIKYNLDLNNKVKLSLSGRNLGESAHLELLDSALSTTEHGLVEPSYHLSVQVNW